MNLNQNGLAPCPFCGGVDAMPYYTMGTDTTRIICPDCTIKGPKLESEPAANKAWNTRVNIYDRVNRSQLRFAEDETFGSQPGEAINMVIGEKSKLETTIDVYLTEKEITDIVNVFKIGVPVQLQLENYEAKITLRVTLENIK